MSEIKRDVIQEELERQQTSLQAKETLIRHFIHEACALMRERDETQRTIQQILNSLSN